MYFYFYSHQGAQAFVNIWICSNVIIHSLLNNNNTISQLEIVICNNNSGYTYIWTFFALKHLRNRSDKYDSQITYKAEENKCDYL